MAVAVGIAVVGFVVAAAAAAAMPSNQATCSVDYRIINQWPGGFQGEVEITYSGSPVDSWTLGFDFPQGQVIRNGWNGDFSQAGDTVTIESMSWNGRLSTGQTVAPGFIGGYDGDNPKPTAFTLNGSACGAGQPDVPAPTTTTTAPTTVPAPPTLSVPSTAPATDPPTPPAPTTTAAPTTALAPPTVAPPSTGMPHNGGKLTAEENLELIKANATRSSRFDNNPFRDVPMNQIQIGDLTEPRDLYGTDYLLDTPNSGFFRVRCEFSHFAYDDPIVFPGEPGRAHLHMFFGNTDANAYSTFDSLLNSGTGTCNGEDLNRTAYWIPAVLDADGNALIPREIMVYYKNDNFTYNGANELVEPFPDNLRMIAGNGGATSPQLQRTGGHSGSIPEIRFVCSWPYAASGDQYQALIPDCSGRGMNMEMQIAFQNCWNPESGTYLTDQSHVSYADGGYYAPKCPASHPYDLSSIMYRIFFSVDEYGGSLRDLHLSSDVKHDGSILPGGTTAHADWFGAWHPGAMEMWVENCNNTKVDCSNGVLDRNPMISMVLQKTDPSKDGYRAPAEELVKLCPGRVFDPSNPLVSVANCHHGGGHGH
ncbi:MAG: DUF1996 domain-containing protein [Actinomycetota bacterium]